MTAEVPTTRWEQSDHSGYARRFAQLIADGEDIEGEARLADALVGRGARILDAGSGMGRVAAGLQRRGHLVTAVEKDHALVERSRAGYPEVAVVEADILELTPALLEAHDRPSSYDLVVVVGNVMILVAPQTERRVLTTLASLLADGGRLLLGFRLVGGPSDAHVYPAEEFVADAEAAGLSVQARFDSFDLRTGVDDEFAVWILSARTPPGAPGSTA